MLRVSAFKRLVAVVLAVLALYLFTRSVHFQHAGKGGRKPLFTQRPQLRLNKNVMKKEPDDECVANSSCQSPRILIKMNSESQSSAPFACINDIRLFKEASLAKGLNVGVLNEDTQAIEEVHYMNLLDGDHELVELLKQIDSHKLLVIASYGDVAAKLSTEARQLLSLFGSSSLETFLPGTSLLFIGQWGLASSKAFEKVSPLNSVNAFVFSECIKAPLGILTNVTLESEAVQRVDENILPELAAVKGRKMNVTLGKRLKDCGLLSPCPKGQIAMSFYSGKDKNDTPRLCINGRFVIDRSINDAGRGLNIVIVDPKTQQVMRSGHFDTYEKESTELVLFLEQLEHGEMLAVVSFDEASSKLSDMAKQIFYELGSSLVHNLKFRASWYFVGQKGIDGFSPFEDLILPSGNDWAKPINERICVPIKLNGLSERRKSLSENSPRRHFCEKYDGYENFCDENQLDLVLTARPLLDPSRSSRPIFSVPILLVAGLSTNNVRLCLESLNMQEGINMQKVLVAFDSAYPEVAELASLFHARAFSINDPVSYNDLVLKSVSRIIDFFPSSPCLIIIEEDVVLSPNFLSFLDQLLEQFLNDDSAGVVLTWNKNGFARTSSIPSLVYRIENPECSAAFLLKRSVFDGFIKGNEKNCCLENERGGWRIPGIAYVPDVSRVLLSAPNIFDNLGEEKKKLFFEERMLVKNETSKVLNVDRLTESAYDVDLRDIIKKSKKIKLDGAATCQPGSALESPVSFLSLSAGDPFVVVYPNQSTVLSVLYSCFHLYYENGLLYGTYKGVTRFSLDGHPALLVSSSSPLLKSFVVPPPR